MDKTTIIIVFYWLENDIYINYCPNNMQDWYNNYGFEYIFTFHNLITSLWFEDGV